MKYTRQRYLAAPDEVQDAERQRLQRQIGFFNLHPERRRILQMGGDENMLANSRMQLQILRLSHYGATTKSVYSTGPTRTSSHIIPLHQCLFLI
jgi:hypothetical protein